MTRCARASWRRVIGGHHGDWITSNEMRDASAGREKWQALQGEICAELATVLEAHTISVPQRTDEEFNAFAAFLSGFVSVCDWIGSDRRVFPIRRGHNRSG